MRCKSHHSARGDKRPHILLKAGDVHVLYESEFEDARLDCAAFRPVSNDESLCGDPGFSQLRDRLEVVSVRFSRSQCCANPHNVVRVANAIARAQRMLLCSAETVGVVIRVNAIVYDGLAMRPQPARTPIVP